MIQITTEIAWVLPWSVYHLSVEFCDNWLTRFCLILLTNRQTDRETPMKTSPPWRRQWWLIAAAAGAWWCWCWPVYSYDEISQQLLSVDAVYPDTVQAEVNSYVKSITSYFCVKRSDRRVSKTIQRFYFIPRFFSAARCSLRNDYECTCLPVLAE